MKDKDFSAGLIHQAIPDMAGTEPRPTNYVCTRCKLPYLDGRICSGSGFTLMCVTPPRFQTTDSSPSVIVSEEKIKEARAQLLYDIAMGICAVRGDSSCPIGDYAHQVDRLIAAVSGQQDRVGVREPEK